MILRVAVSGIASKTSRRSGHRTFATPFSSRYAQIASRVGAVSPATVMQQQARSPSTGSGTGTIAAMSTCG